MREIIKEGRDINEAVALACQELGVEAEQAEVEIINLPKRSFFGLKNTPAKVRVYIKEEEKKQPPKEMDRPKWERTAVKQEEKKPAKPMKRVEEDKKQKQDLPLQPEKRPVQGVEEPEKQERKDSPPFKPAQRKPFAEQKSEGSEPEKPLVFMAMGTTEGKARVACEYVQSVLLEMGVNAEIMVANREGGIVLRLVGEGLGVVIGRRGETLDSLQYLASLVANRAEGEYMRVTIDSGNYREKRERTLQQLAQKISSTVLRSGRGSTLEAMNPYERRIIHSAVSSIEGVTSSSIGIEPNRRVVISPINGGRPQGGQNRGKGPRDFKGGRDGRSTYRGGRPPRKSGEGTGVEGSREGGYRERMPRRENAGFQRPQEAGGKPTSTDVDRAYAMELEKEALPVREVVVKPETPEGAPVREKGLREGSDLPLYGKIEL